MINPTPEQQAVIDWQGDKLVVNAFAGTGKTSTLVKYAENHPELRMLYIAFNRSVREEADEKFPANVLCKTSHQQIYRFRGAVDALNAPSLSNADRLWLTHSFRFGACIADMANALLAMNGETHQVVGRGEKDDILFDIPKQGFPHRAILSRTVAGVIGSALEASSKKATIYWVNGIGAYRIDELINLHER